MTNGSSAVVYGYDSPDCGYYEQECSDIQQQQQQYHPQQQQQQPLAMQLSDVGVSYPNGYHLSGLGQAHHFSAGESTPTDVIGKPFFDFIPPSLF